MAVLKPLPPFFIQITDANGLVVRTRYGGKHERDLIEAIVAKCLEKGVGFFRTESHVAQDLREAITEVIYDLKIKNPADVVN